MGAASEVESWWEFFKRFANDVGGRIPAASIMTFVLLAVLSYRNPEQALSIAKRIHQYLYGMFFHPMIIRTYTQEQLRQHEEIKELKAQIASLRSVLLDVLVILRQKQEPDETIEKIIEVLKAQ